MNGPVVCALFLAIAVVATAVLVVSSQHQSRALFTELQELNRERDRLDAEWGMLRLEQGAWATHGRIERLAREKLDMVMPGGENVIVLRRGGTDND
ncbi:cell division protein FtsL [Aquisalimonas sp.]|uniref:cell division protein FtsL n=1 Tax=Aquisalimonas sp. TaxID=1872621 RepID=UPI0025BAC955|nr:cell division protein FtsL [Aquisalimonas sp.]